MRKQFIILSILVFVLGLIPANFSNAITQNQINAEVQIVCPDNYGNWFSGSGTIIDSKGIILTNKHVVSDQYGGIIKTCFIGFTESINQEPNFGTPGNYNLAEVKYYTTTDDMDAAILYLNNTADKNYAYVDIWNSNSNSLQFGHKIEVIGFPSIGGATITYTSGDFSGFGSKSDGTQNYIKSTAQLEHGNSGGASYNSSGQFIGIPTMVVAGTLNSLSYLLSVNSIKQWLQKTIGNNYQQQVIKDEPKTNLELNQNIQGDVTPPQVDSGWYDVFSICSEDGWCNKIGRDAQVDGESNKVHLMLEDFYVSHLDPNSKVVKTLYSYSKKLSNLNSSNEKSKTLDYTFNTSGSYYKDKYNDWIQNFKQVSLTDWLTLDDYGIYYISVRFVDENGNISDKQIFTYNYQEIDKGLTEKLKGKILLQIEENGEAWYVYPKTGKRYYMANGDEAYLIMRFLGVGINNKDLNRVKADKNFAMKNSGKIFLQVEEHGEAYYIDFDGNAHYLKDGNAAYNTMRDLGLGITTDNLKKISYGINEDIKGYLEYKEEKKAQKEGNEAQERIEKFNKELKIDITETDLCKNVYYIFYKGFNPNEVSLCGIKLGDNKDKVEINSKDTVNNPGWIFHWNGTGYVNYNTDNNSKVTQMQIDYGELINKINSLGLKEEDMEIVLGKPDEIKAKGLRFLWGSDKILTVTISSN